MRCAPCRIAAAGRVAGDVDKIFDGEAQAAKWAVVSWWKRKPFDERAGLFDGYGLHERLLYRALANALRRESNTQRQLAKKLATKNTKSHKKEKNEVNGRPIDLFVSFCVFCG